MQKDISIIIPVYNSEMFLNRCLDSVCGQDLDNIEIICIDDASSDKSADILRNYVLRDERILIITMNHNRGASAARNIGITVASGKSIGFVDSDDTIDSDFYLELKNGIDQSDADVVEANIRIVDGKGKKYCPLQWSWFCSSLFRADFLKKNSICFPAGFRCEDTVFMARVLLHLPVRKKVEGTYYNYYQILSSGSHKNTDKNAAKDLSAYELIFSEILQYAAVGNISQEYAQNISFIFFQQLLYRISRKFSDHMKLLASKFLINFYRTHPYIEGIDSALAQSDPVLLELLRKGDSEKLASFLLLGKRIFADKLRKSLINRGTS